MITRDVNRMYHQSPQTEPTGTLKDATLEHFEKCKVDVLQAFIRVRKFQDPSFKYIYRWGQERPLLASRPSFLNQ